MNHNLLTLRSSGENEETIHGAEIGHQQPDERCGGI